MDVWICIFTFLYLVVLMVHGGYYIQKDTQPIMQLIPGDRRLDLSHHGLTKVPPNLPRNTQYLDLSYNNITCLYSRDLEALPDLLVLKFSHSNLQLLSHLALQGNQKLQVLDISSNALKTIPEFTLPDLRQLDVLENLYTSYALGKYFQNLQNLNSLSLGSPWANSVNIQDFSPLCGAPLKYLQLGAETEIDQYKPGSFICLSALQKLTLKMSFCQKPKLLDYMLQDLDRINFKSLTFVKFVPDQCNVPKDMFTRLKAMKKLLNLTFMDTWFNSSVLTDVVISGIQSPLLAVFFLNITFAQDTPEGVQIHTLPGYNQTVELRAVTFHIIHHHQYYFPLISINATLFPHLTHLKFSSTGMSIIPCNMISALPSLKVLDLSDNVLHNHGLWWPACSSRPRFPSLTELNLRGNKFKDLQFISNHTHEMRHLSTLDLSNNVINLGKTNWPSHITSLSLSNNLLGDAVFDYLSPYIQTLNLSQTGITVLSHSGMSQLNGTRRLFMSFNNIRSMPSDLWMPRLEELHLDYNSISTFQESSFKGLFSLRRLKLGNNPFICNCELYWFVTSFNKTNLLDWPSNYVCYGPPNLAGLPLERFQPTRVSCDSSFRAVVSLSIVLLIAAALALGFYACDGAWYLQMLWVWMRVKRRGLLKAQRAEQVYIYHAFISYSQKDGKWVESQFLPYLEGEKFSLCIHERDFIPGEWIIDNIINCLERSSMTLFVLSQNFIQSQWCNYELFFAQHRALGVQQDSLVFVLLEPIPADSLPRRFLKLRSLLGQQTYLEWPQDNQHKQRIFWARLKALLHTPHTVLESIATDLCPLLKHMD